jgi:hypothetical protein
MNEGANEAVQTPGSVLLAAGAVLAVFYALYALWTGVGLLLGCMSTGFSGLAMVNGDDGAAVGLGFGVWGLVLSSISFIVYLGLAGGGAYVASGGMAMRALDDITKVRRGVMLALILPITGLLMNGAMSLLSFSCCGLIFGSVPHLLVCALGGAAWFMANQALQESTVASAFKS